MRHQRDFYDQYFASHVTLPVEELKQRARLDAIVELVSDVRFVRVLVVGCGLGGELPLFIAKDLVALDLSHVAVKVAGDKYPAARFVQGNGTHLPIRSGYFDLVLCSEVIEHVPQPCQLVAELHRILKPGGTLIISTPNSISVWGLARLIGQILLRRPVTSGGQPIDNWSSSSQLVRLLQDHFEVDKRRGVWYFPPTGLGLRRLPDTWVLPILRRLRPMEVFLSTAAPGLGHLHVWRATGKS
jgi:2-polyprenyl-3-methyl-5-hydroxy-6-metoxy-1,4-benzoquinol methylase